MCGRAQLPPTAVTGPAAEADAAHRSAKLQSGGQLQHLNRAAACCRRCVQWLERSIQPAVDADALSCLPRDSRQQARVRRHLSGADVQAALQRLTRVLQSSGQAAPHHVTCVGRMSERMNLFPLVVSSGGAHNCLCFAGLQQYTHRQMSSEPSMQHCPPRRTCCNGQDKGGAQVGNHAAQGRVHEQEQREPEGRARSQLPMRQSDRLRSTQAPLDPVCHAPASHAAPLTNQPNQLTILPTHFHICDMLWYDTAVLMAKVRAAEEWKVA